VHVARRVAGFKKIRYYTHENIGYGPVSLPDLELHTTAVWWQLSQRALDQAFDHRQQALDGFLAAAHALHIVATVAVMAEARDLQKAVGSGDGAWFATPDANGRAQVRSSMGELDASAHGPFIPTLYLYDAFPGGVGLSAPLYERREDLVRLAHELVVRCDCRAGCPACVGPVLAADEQNDTPLKMLAMRVLDLVVAL
jgi:DEAD/DEAH box helicase domain-containing protein